LARVTFRACCEKLLQHLSLLFCLLAGCKRSPPLCDAPQFDEQQLAIGYRFPPSLPILSTPSTLSASGWEREWKQWCGGREVALCCSHPLITFNSDLKLLSVTSRKSQSYGDPRAFLSATKSCFRRSIMIHDFQMKEMYLRRSTSSSSLSLEMNSKAK
jgi:hypothetical protein